MMRPRYFTPNEVAAHNSADDLWVSFLGKVLDLTPLIWANGRDNPLLRPMIDVAGKDISHWFKPKTRELRTFVDPETGLVRPYTPVGRVLHVPLPYPDSSWATDFGRPWWKNDDLLMGFLTRKTRFVNIVNTLTSQKQVVEVCSEETIEDILNRYLFYNAHAASYTWKYNKKPLVMSKTLAENGIDDEDDEFFQLRMDCTDYKFRQTLHLYFNDDLTEA